MMFGKIVIIAKYENNNISVLGKCLANHDYATE